jgi:hypothetical protein
MYLRLMIFDPQGVYTRFHSAKPERRYADFFVVEIDIQAWRFAEYR